MALDMDSAGPAPPGPADHAHRAHHVQQAAKPTEPRSHVKVAHDVSRPADELAVRRELRSWASAAAWLNARGYAAAVPVHLVVPLARRGLVVWPENERRTA